MMEQPIHSLAELGVAGVMGALWVWERAMSRRRETQLDEAHRKLLAEREQLSAMVELIRHNTEVIERWNQSQQRLMHFLDRMNRRYPHGDPIDPGQRD